MSPRSEQERPVHRFIDLSTGVVTDVPISDREWDELDALTAQAEADQRTAQAEADQIRQQVKEHPDPLVRLLAQKAGLA